MSTAIPPVVVVEEIAKPVVVEAVVETVMEDEKQPSLTIRSPTDLLAVPKRTIISVNGSRGAGKTRMRNDLKLFIGDKDAPNVVIVDTDTVLASVRRKLASIIDTLTEEQSAQFWLLNLHPALKAFFESVPDGALVICCGVCDEVASDVQANGMPSFQYLVPNISWSKTFFIDTPPDQIVAQRFEREVRQYVLDPALAKVYTAPGARDLFFSGDRIRQEIANDRHVYVETLKYSPLPYDDVLSQLKGLVQVWMLTGTSSR